VLLAPGILNVYWGAAMKAMMKQVVAASSVGIINTPNQPMYSRLSVDVIQLQNRSHKLALCDCKVVVMFYECLI